MEVFKEIVPLRASLKTHKMKGRSIGLVPTMGALHDGHLALIHSSIRENDITVCSIFVNPTQFNNQSDLDNYPRELQKDLERLSAQGCDFAFVPEDSEMYKSKPTIKMEFGEVEKIMEGAFRPGHFNGVGIVVSKLFNIIEPDRAYFGQKDLQQFIIIKQLTKDLSFPVELRSIDIVREVDGLAKSSRNLRLSPEERKKSVALHQSLLLVKKLLEEGVAVERAKQDAEKLFKVPGIRLEYLEIVDADSLMSITNISDKNSVAICVAAYVGEIRLIDNMVLRINSK